MAQITNKKNTWIKEQNGKRQADKYGKITCHLTPDTHKTRKKQQAYETKDKQSDGERNSKEHILRGLKYTV